MEFDDMVIQDIEVYKSYIRDLLDQKAIKRRRIESKREAMMIIMRKKKRKKLADIRTFHRAPLHVSTGKYSTFVEKDMNFTRLQSKMEKKI